MIMCAALSTAGIGMSSFRIRHSSIITFLLQILQGSPAVVGRPRTAVASRLIAICATYRADALAVLLADPLHRQGQQDLLLNYVGDLDAESFIKPDLGFS